MNALDVSATEDTIRATEDIIRDDEMINTMHSAGTTPMAIGGLRPKLWWCVVMWNDLDSWVMSYAHHNRSSENRSNMEARELMLFDRGYATTRELGEAMRLANERGLIGSYLNSRNVWRLAFYHQADPPAFDSKIKIEYIDFDLGGEQLVEEQPVTWKAFSGGPYHLKWLGAPKFRNGGLRFQAVPQVDTDKRIWLRDRSCFTFHKLGDFQDPIRNVAADILLDPTRLSSNSTRFMVRCGPPRASVFYWIGLV
jgi:hypothetical protein